MKLTINGDGYEADIEPEMPLLWAIRDVVGLTGTKFGCGIGACGACSIHLDGQLVRSCILPASSAEGRKITTIEGLSGKGAELQRAWISIQVPQCGYCQSGMLMAATDLLARNPHPDDAAIDAAMANICRCGTYARIKAAIHLVASGKDSASGHEKSAVKKRVKG
ncbi:(2Fe-2S)-binding protein [Paraburkholderia fungorum]|uniref:(2Fe-2S)-binding protein n=1 Tax=Paraburkholderia fungorum TaxID=134537 RepID=A0A3R7FBC8_9BURK|nr:(2Fe-2S)-binding protein [Paraburkholderia fungorum]RKF49893.1 (2Fe-2S)-binding protein [Paraburkholderia fungorum]